MPNILDPKFKYTTSAKTDIRKTFAKVRREQKAKEEKDRADANERILKVRKLG